ncbi:MAG TPA: DUF4394 domain-containing protein [Pyrinomonadaceae bacterium]|jgi:hypothetical protein|nr:DUF4394 domain-containing protein [Pyrinomonadaceae bacterium]
MRQSKTQRSRWIMPLLFVMMFVVGQTAAYAVTIYGVTTTNQLTRFDSATPATNTTVGTITGLQAGENIVAIDFRPANGQLYALGSTSRLYTINLTTGAATMVGTAGAFTLQGTEFGFDFNPVVDRIRVVSNTGQNLRLNPNDGTLSGTDTPISPATANITGAAYTNNFAGSTTTTLYDIDSTLDSLFIQGGENGTPSPNGGTLTLRGALGVDASAANGFDIGSSDGIAFAAFNVGGTSQLYRINLTTGTATLVGPIGGGMAVRGIAVAFGGGATGNTVLDYDGDRRTDFAVFRTTNSTFFVRRSSNGTFFGQQFGQASTDIQVPGDYDGDGRTDLAVFRTTNGTFFIQNSSNNTFRAEQFGLGTDEPVARDYDGDRRTDLAVVRRENGLLTWFIRNSSNGSFRAEQFGLATDVVAPGDYDGDGRFDLAVFRGAPNQPANFFVRLSSTGGFRAEQFGLGSDLVVPGDYDGDGRYDFAVVREGSLLNWFILNSSNRSFRQVQFGDKGQFTVQGDYDGDGRTDIATFEPSTGTFYVLQSSTMTATSQNFGRSDDYPVANYDTH